MPTPRPEAKDFVDKVFDYTFDVLFDGRGEGQRTDQIGADGRGRSKNNPPDQDSVATRILDTDQNFTGKDGLRVGWGLRYM